MPYTPSETTPGTDDWLCSKCGQVSNNSEPCYACDRKEREAHPIPPPPPAPDRPTRDTSKKSWPPPAPPLPPQGPYANASRKRTHRSERQPSNTPYTVSSPRSKRRKINRSPMMTNYEHMMCDMYEEEEWQADIVEQYKQSLHWLRRLTDWIFGVRYNFVDVPDSYFEATKSKGNPKRPGEQMATFEELFEGYEDDGIKEKPEGSYGTYKRIRGNND